MRFLLSLVLGITLQAQFQSPVAVEPAKLALIREIAEAQNLKSSAIQTIDASARLIGHTLQANPKTPPSLIGDFEAAVKRRANELDVVSLIAPDYAQSFSIDELQQLVAFYQTPLGKKLAEHGSVIDEQISNRERSLGSHFGVEAMNEVMAAHPEYVAQVGQSNGLTEAVPTAGSPPVRIGAAVAQANLVNQIQPVYPPLALSAKVSGNVTFSIVIDKQGNVTQAQLIQGHPLLVNAAKNALLQWTYKPTLLNGNPVYVVTSATVPFVLPQ